MSAALSAGCRVFAIPDARQNVDCARSGLLWCSDTVVTENHAPAATSGAVHHDVSPRASTHDADAKSRDLAVRDRIMLVSNFGGFDKMLGDLGHDGPVF